MKNVYKIYLFTNIASHYRESLWIELLKSDSFSMHFYFGKNNPTNIKSIDLSNPSYDKYSRFLHGISNSWLNGRIVLWQRGVPKACSHISMDFAIFNSDMWCISTWIAAAICRLRGIKVVFWGHGFYGRESTLRLLVRKKFYKLANYHLLYERNAKQLMIKHGFDEQKLYIIFNSLNYQLHKKLRTQFLNVKKAEAFPFFNDPNLRTLVFVGRLTITKKLQLLVNSALYLNKDDVKFNLLIIGDGDERESLVKLGQRGTSDGWLCLIGPCYDETLIGKYLYFADLCISPGNVGLTAIHSLSFGTPVCTHSNLSHQGPEAGAIIEGYNGCFFEENSITSMCQSISMWFEENNSKREEIRKRCYEIVDKYYNPNYQINVLHNLLDSHPPEL